MFKVVEAFSGIGSQAKALANTGMPYSIEAIIEWDIFAFCAYDVLHNGQQEYEGTITQKNKIIDELMSKGLSYDGKKPVKRNQLKKLSEETLNRISYSFKRSKNLANITKVNGKDLPDNIDLLTYSFPCQDLSIGSFWWGNFSGIDRESGNRSSMLWEIERLLEELKGESRSLPSFLLMENVTTILSTRHKENFDEWKANLEKFGYINFVYTLNAADFGVPQKRKRTYMISVMNNYGEKGEKYIKKYFEEADLENFKTENPQKLEDFLFLNYKNERYLEEALESQPNYTPSRIKIYKNNTLLLNSKNEYAELTGTITTKQDRHPNAGNIFFNMPREGKAPYRNLTPRECFVLMGFNESDYQKIIDNNFLINKSKKFFTKDKLIKMAGNSIVVPVLEQVFSHIINLDSLIERDLKIKEERAII